MPKTYFFSILKLQENLNQKVGKKKVYTYNKEGMCCILVPDEHHPTELMLKEINQSIIWHKPLFKNAGGWGCLMVFEEERICLPKFSQFQVWRNCPCELAVIIWTLLILSRGLRGTLKAQSHMQEVAGWRNSCGI